MLPFTIKQLKDWAGPDVYRRAEMLVDNQRVFRSSYRNRKIEGMIEARPRDISCAVEFPPGDVAPVNLCPCRDNREMGLFCHHATALCLDQLKLMTDPVRMKRLQEEQRSADRITRVSEADYLTRVPPGTPGAIAVKLLLEFPSDLRSVWWEDAIPLRLLIEHNGRRESIRNVKPGIPLALPSAEDNLLFVLEDIAGGPVPDLMQISPRNLANVFELLQGMRVSFGGREGQVSRNKIPASARVSLDDETGIMELGVDIELPKGFEATLPAYWVEGKKAWVLLGDTLFPLANVLPEPMYPMYVEPLRIQRAAVPRFIRKELDIFTKHVEIRMDVDLTCFHFTPETPGFRLDVRGSPASLSATLHANYGGVEWIAGDGTNAEDFVLPDPDNVLLYRTRNPEAEREALDSLRLMGFGGERGDKMEGIVGHSAVMNFCASGLPTLRRRGWNVQLSGRIAEELDAAEHLMPVVRVSDTEAGWFDVDCEFETRQGESLRLADVRQAIAAGDAYVRKGDRLLLFDRDAVRQMFDLFDDCGKRAEGRGGVRMSAVHGAFLKSTLDALDGVDVEATPQWLQRVEAQNQPARLENIQPSPNLKADLRPYQRAGLNWLSFLERARFAGILADEMGLGKTLQTLAWIQLRRDDETLRECPALIVCPTSLVENWIEEGGRFTPNLRFANLTGSPGQREKAWNEDAPKAQVWVTSYAVLQRDVARYAAVMFSVVALDEAQNIKNRDTQNARAVKQLQAGTRLVLTGTPVENSVSDLWSIMDFLMPGYLGLHDTFRRRYESPIKMGGIEAVEAQKRLRKKLQPFLLRRLKRDVAKDLPPKIEKVAWCRMTTDQKMVYTELVRKSQRKLEDMVAQQGFQRSRMEILKTLLQLRQTCCHLELLKLPGLKSEAPSGKLEMFREMILEAVDGGHRVLVFSQFTSMLAILRRELEAMQLTYCYLDGSTQHRMDVVRRFQGDATIPLFLISLKAGGTGLNLTGADMVIHYDPWWNPAVENQATDRAYRIGQQRNVYSLKLITRDSVEEKVLALQQRKQQVIDATLDTDGQMLQSLEWEDVQELLRI